ncbi:MAG: hypothetical protein FJY75_04775, partial [Candidatus Eisenbacteria bacterium]|nr:hypothetical protein [Candidatus Eisenbacteria bacterium]
MPANRRRLIALAAQGRGARSISDSGGSLRLHGRRPGRCAAACARAGRTAPGRAAVGRAALALLAAAALACGLAAAPRATGPLDRSAARKTPWFVEEADASRLVVVVEAGAPLWQPLDERSGLYDLEGFDARDELAGAPVPSLRLLVAVPPRGDVVVGAASEGLRALPRSTDELARAGDPGSDGEGWLDADASGRVQYRPPSWHGDQRLVALRVRPVWLDPAGRLSSVERLRIRLGFDAGDAAATGREVPSPPFPPRMAWPEPAATAAGEVARGDAGLVNPGQARLWQRVAVPPPARLAGRGEGFETATSPWLRLEVRKRGVYRLTTADLSAAGIDPSGVDPEALRLFCGPAGVIPEAVDFLDLPDWMEPCALLVEDDGDHRWDAQTGVYFLANGPDGWRDDLGLPDVGEGDRYYAHPYSASFTYWLCWGGDWSDAPLRMRALDADPGTLDLLEEADQRLHFGRNAFYDSRPRQMGGAWPRYFQHSVSASEAEIGASVVATLPGVVPEAGARLRVSLWGASWGVDGLNNDHWARIRVNGALFDEAWWEGVARRDIAGTLAVAPPTAQVSLYVPQRYDAAQARIGDKVYLDWVEVDYRRSLATASDSLDFFASAAEAGSRGFRVTGLSRQDGWLLLDAGDAREPTRLLPRIAARGPGYAAEFRVQPAGEETHLVLLRADRAARPDVVEVRTPPVESLRGRTAAVDYLIVTAPELRPAAEALAAHRRLHFYGEQGDTLVPAEVAVVEIGQVFDEFAWGQRDPAALRNFLAYARRFWTGGAPAGRLSHALFFGDASEDPRNYRGGAARDLVPSYESYEWVYQLSQSWIPGFWGDDWFALLDGPGDRGLDLAVGRLPAASLAQATIMVDKIIRAETEPPPGPWKTRMIFAADDVCQGNEVDNIGYAHMVQTESLTRLGVPAGTTLEKLYLYEYGSECRYERKPQATADLLAAIERGALLFNFVGHGSEIQLADERLLDNSSIAGLANTHRPFLMITASCAVGRFTHGGAGLALQALRMPSAGALGVVSASSSASSAYNYTLNLLLLQQLFADGDLLRPRSFGAAMRRAKTLNARDNDRRYNLLGDPGSRFLMPAHALALRLEDVPGVPAGADTLIRGAPATLRGRVLDPGGATAVDFQGTVELRVLDSDIHRSPVPSIPSRDYRLPGARIFSGTATVTGGEFSCPFFVPTALRTGARGAAGIQAYALAGGSGGTADATGALAGLFIPEKREPAPGDTLGPVI